jgi:hypothetical protein
MTKKKLTKGMMSNLVDKITNEKGIIAEQNWIWCCEPGMCGCMPEIIPGDPPCGGATQYANSTDCHNDLTNCCTKYECTRATGYQCQATGDQNAPFDTLGDCQLAHPNGCAPAPDEYDCNASTGYVCAASPGGPFSTLGQCLSTHPQGCTPPPDDYDCVQGAAGFQCIVQAGGTFQGPTAQADCQNAVANNIAPCNRVRDPKAYDCVNRDGVMVCIPDLAGPFTGPTAQADCNACVANPNCPDCNDPVGEQYQCIDEVDPDNPSQLTGNKICVLDPSGPFTSQAACQACIANPNCPDCRDDDPTMWNCVEKTHPGGDIKGPGKGPTWITGDEAGRTTLDRNMLQEQASTMACVPDANGPFTSQADCQACVADPKCPECNRGEGGFGCTGSGCEPGGCGPMPNGPYNSMADCEANTDDHYNLGFCDCCCPGQPEGCDAQPLISTIPVINGEYHGMHGQPYEVGMTNLNLNDAKDKDGPLLTKAFRDRMAPCGPSYRAPGGNVKHDCSFWEFIATKKLVNKYNAVITPASQGGLASVQAENPWHMAHATNVYSGGTLGGYPFLPWVADPVTGILGPMIHANTGLPINPHGGTQSGTAHPRWQRRIEAKIAYVNCLRENCCMNTDWPYGGEVFTPWM